MVFDFSAANIARIKKQYAAARKELTYAQGRHAWSRVDAVRVGYRNLSELQAQADADLAVAQAAFDAIKSERDAYRARGFCR